MNVHIKSIKKIIHKSLKQYYDVINANPYNNFLIKTNSSYICSHNCFFDEISFQPNIQVEKQIEKATTLVNTASARMQSRFMKGQKNPTLLILASSKRTEQSYMQKYIQNKRKQQSKTTLVVDEPQWIIRTDKDSPNKFKIAIGNKFLDSQVLPLGVTKEQVDLYRNRGFKILDIPMGYYENFVDDINIALTDIAGISTSTTNRYISGTRLAETKTDKYINLFTKQIIQVGNAPDDKTQYYDFIDMSRVPQEYMYKPLYVHLDMSISGDKTGIAGVWIIGKKHSDDNNLAKDLFYQVAFVVSVKAPKGYQISFQKNRNFIYWLKENGFNLKSVSADSFQSPDTLQALSARGINTTVISVDRVDSSHICQPYQTFRNVIYEKRIYIPKNDLLTQQILGLQRDNNSGKIDHSPQSINSKDSSDAVCGAVYNASLHAEEYQFDYGEDVETTLQHNETVTVEDMSKLFQQELMNNFSPISTQKLKQQDKFLNFGMGKATPVNNPFINNGILVW